MSWRVEFWSKPYKIRPGLEELSMSGNKNLLADEGVALGVVEVLERRTDFCPRLERVNFHDTGLDDEGEAGNRLSRLLGLEEEEEGDDDGDEEEEE